MSHPHVVRRINKHDLWIARIMAWQDAGDPRGLRFVNQRMLQAMLFWDKALCTTPDLPFLSYIRNRGQSFCEAHRC